MPIILNIPTEPYWLGLPGEIKILVRPCTTAIFEAGRAKGSRLCGELLQEHEDITNAGGKVEGLPDLNDPDAVIGLSQYLFVSAMASAAIIEWEGVIDEEGNLVELAEKSVSELMRFQLVADAFLAKYLSKQTELITEGNASGLSPNGTSAGALNTAKDAKKPASRARAAE